MSPVVKVGDTISVSFGNERRIYKVTQVVRFYELFEVYAEGWRSPMLAWLPGGAPNWMAWHGEEADEGETIGVRVEIVSVSFDHWQTNLLEQT